MCARLRSFSTAFATLATVAVFPAQIAAQIVPDDTLPNASRIDRVGEILNITGGTEAGTNLFHSFEDFNVRTGETARFDNATSIDNIITRVTGGRVSEIDGLLQANGNANLFLINPRGWIFGANASLDIGGSLWVSTANALQFDDGAMFSAIEPQTPLLSVNVPVGLQYGRSPASIQLQQALLRLEHNRTLSLLGGNVLLNGTTIEVPGGSIELGGLADMGTVALNDRSMVVRFDEGVDRADVTLLDGAQIDVRDDRDGQISIEARNVSLEASALQAGIVEERGVPGASAGDIDIRATGRFSVSQNSKIVNQVSENSLGMGGDISIEADSVFLSDSAVSVATRGRGDAGHITVRSRENVVLTSQMDRSSGGMGAPPMMGSRPGNPQNPMPDTPANMPIGLFSSVLSNATGNGGNIHIETPELQVEGGAQISSDTFGAGHGGLVRINANQLTVRGSNISAVTDGVGNGGQLDVRVRDRIELAQILNLPTRLDSVVRSNATGDGGSIIVETGELAVLNGAVVTADTFGRGNSGNITIRTTESVTLSGRSGARTSAILAAVRPNAEGNGGYIDINTPHLFLIDGGNIDTGTDSLGGSGNIVLRATESIELSSPNSNTPSTIRAQVNTRGTGSGGNITIETVRLSLRDGGQISTATFGDGVGGNLEVRATDSIEAVGLGGNVLSDNGSDGSAIPSIVTDAEGNAISGLFASSPGVEDAGALVIETDRLSVRDGAQISVSSRQQGTTGDLNIRAERLLLDGGTLSAQTVEGDNANIPIESRNLQLRRGSNITTNATGSATGGNISIQTDTLVALENSDISANAEFSSGGRVTIESQGIFGTAFRDRTTSESDITATSLLGAAFSGTVDIREPEVETTSGLVELPNEPIDISGLVVDRCAALRSGSEFVVTQRGGLPEDPIRGLLPLRLWRDTRPLVVSETESSSSIEPVVAPDTIQEATGWQVNADGSVELVSGRSTSLALPSCRDRGVAIDR
ncbi:MAG: S-layer family protein [Cyanobacteria bacterium SID2]|nr:S-layer family protein [Cyanobacteria bacterium SID2]MBP0005356.1 S-layer family protein [Cyanobacteria bacterium SBC]